MTSNIWIQSHLNSEGTNIYKNMLFNFLKENNASEEQITFYKWFNIHSNPEGKHINYVSRFFNEYCVLYYVWKNNIYSDIVSFCHYKRHININHIKNNFLINSDYIQYYDSSILVELDSIEYETLYNKYDKYYFMMSLLGNTYFPKFILDDMYEYLSQQTIVDQITLQKTTDYHPGCFYFPCKTIFSCNWNEFDRMMKFMDGFFTYFFNKHNLEYNDRQIYNFLNENVIEHYRNIDFNDITDKLSAKIDELLFKGRKASTRNKKIKAEILSKTLQNIRCYATPKQYEEIFNKNTKYGINTYCNTWRTFGYITEILFGIYVLCNKSFICPYNKIEKKIVNNYEFNNMVIDDYTIL